MPRLSLWRSNKTDDYRFIDRTISEQFTVGGLDIYIHKYLGVKMGAESKNDATQPHYDEENPLFVEDLLLLENRNRSYEEDVYTLRGVYNVQDIDFDLSQFGIFIQNDQIRVGFHYNDMIDHIGRKLMNGDVLEIPNLKDYHPLDESIPKALPKYYVINDASFASEGFSPTWLPHIWRVKAVPLVGSQEYKDIYDKFIDDIGGIDGDDGEGNGSGTLADYLCQHNKNLEINDAVLTQAEVEVPLSGYDVDKFYVIDPGEEARHGVYIRADNSVITVDSDYLTADSGMASPESNGFVVGYLTGDGMPPNGAPLTTGVAFPTDASVGDYVLRVDYVPNRLFRFNGQVWAAIEDDVRTNITLAATDNHTQRDSFVNNDEVIETTDRGTIPSRQSLSNLLKPEDDN